MPFLFNPTVGAHTAVAYQCQGCTGSGHCLRLDLCPRRVPLFNTCCGSINSPGSFGRERSIAYVLSPLRSGTGAKGLMNFFCVSFLNESWFANVFLVHWGFAFPLLGCVYSVCRVLGVGALFYVVEGGSCWYNSKHIFFCFMNAGGVGWRCWGARNGFKVQVVTISSAGRHLHLVSGS